MRNILVLALLCLLTFSCSKDEIVGNTKKIIVDYGSQAISTLATCEKPEVIKEWLGEKINIGNNENERALSIKGVDVTIVGKILCMTVLDKIKIDFAFKRLPKEANCTYKNAQVLTDGAIGLICSKIE